MWTKTYKVVGFLEPGIVRFGDKNLTVYISQKAIDRYSHRLKGKPITIGHIEGITEANAQEYSVGDVAVCDKPGDCIVTINKEEAERKIESGERFSCCWIPKKWGPSGTWHNIPYDKELVEMDFTHLAIVPDPRYENVEVFMNSKGCERKAVKISSFKNSLSSGQYSFLKKHIKGWSNAKEDEVLVGDSAQDKRELRAIRKMPDSPSNSLNRRINARVAGSIGPEENRARLKSAYSKTPSSFFNAKVDKGLSTEQKREVRFDRNVSTGKAPQNPMHSLISYKGKKGGLSQEETRSQLNRTYNNEAQPPDDSLERMSKINAYLQKRENRRIDKQYQTEEAPKQFADRYSEHFAGYRNCSYKRKDGKEFNNNVFKEALKKWVGNGRGESRIDNTRSLLTEQTGKMPTISKGPKGAVGRISESKAKRIAEDL